MQVCSSHGHISFQVKQSLILLLSHSGKTLGRLKFGIHSTWQLVALEGNSMSAGHSSGAQHEVHPYYIDKTICTVTSQHMRGSDHMHTCAPKSCVDYW